MANTMMDRLRSQDKKGLFNATSSNVLYRTGFIPFDYRNGCIVEVRDMRDKLVSTYPSLGLQGGSFVTIIGKSGTAKTTFAIQAAAQIVKPFENNAFVMHVDLEASSSITRIRNITNFKNQELTDKYILKQEKCYIEDVFAMITTIAKEKEQNKKEYTYDTGYLDEFGRPIFTYVPTVFILDSIPSMQPDPQLKENEIAEMESATYANRTAKALAQFYRKLMPIVKGYNILVIAINHITQKVDINPMARTAPTLLYLKQDESMPGGVAPVYYPTNILKFVAIGSEKYNEKENGFDGVLTRVEFLKSRTNKAGQHCNLVFNQTNGFDPILSQLQFAIDNDLVDGRNPYRYLKGFKDIKFDSRAFKKNFLENQQLRLALMDATIPILEKQLTRRDTTDLTSEETLPELTDDQIEKSTQLMAG